MVMKKGRVLPNEKRTLKRMAPAIPIKKIRRPPIRSANGPFINFPMAYAISEYAAIKPNCVLVYPNAWLISGNAAGKFGQQR